MFLYLMYLYPEQPIIPTREIDIVWHFHILDTRKYAFDCKILFGYFLHHRPSSESKTVLHLLEDFSILPTHHSVHILLLTDLRYKQ
jgi:hypothetical protein